MKYEELSDKEKAMSPAEVTTVLSETLRDLSQRKITLRQALVIARVATALTKVIEVSDLNDRVALIEHVLKQRKSK